MIILKDIAQIVGVSTATVSKALRDFGDISPETKNKVRRVAREIGYLGPSAHREQSRKRIIGIIYEPVDRFDERTPFERGVIDGLYRHAYSAGYACLFLSGERGDRELSYMAMARHYDLAALCIVRGDFFSTQLRDVLCGEIPVAALEPFGMPAVLEMPDEVHDWGMIVSGGSCPAQEKEDETAVRRRAEKTGEQMLQRLLAMSERPCGEVIRPVYYHGAVLRTAGAGKNKEKRS